MIIYVFIFTQQKAMRSLLLPDTTLVWILSVGIDSSASEVL